MCLPKTDRRFEIYIEKYIDKIISTGNKRILQGAGTPSLGYDYPMKYGTSKFFCPVFFISTYSNF